MQNAPDITVTCEVGEEHAAFLEAKLREAWRHVDRGPPCVSVAVVDARAMAGLHQRFLGVDGPTDVLTFELERDLAGRVTEGEIVVCLDVALQEARRRGHNVRHELLLYALHGLLHLCGYHDLDEAGFARMHEREDEILRSLGIGPVFQHREETG